MVCREAVSGVGMVPERGGQVSAGLPISAESGLPSVEDVTGFTLPPRTKKPRRGGAFRGDGRWPDQPLTLSRPSKIWSRISSTVPTPLTLM